MSTDQGFYNRNGTLTRYAMACGYLEVYGDWLNGHGVRLGLEGGVFHVKGSLYGERVWEVFDTVTDARRFARKCGTFRPAPDAFTLGRAS